MPGNNLKKAKAAEAIASEYLKTKNYKILARNYRTRLGELDIIAKDKDTFCFIEVKARTSARFGSALEAVNRAKQRKISQVALAYLKANSLLGKNARFDVVSVSGGEKEAKIDLIKNAFELDPVYTY